ncbi:MAG: hypothetical protein JSS87_09580 [Acidobacteria bacterium]|nr:hypothetical protein [Acidobacteriota bacterium]
MKLLTSMTAVATLLAATALTSQTGAVFNDNAKPQHATVSILAVSSQTHNGYSGSQDIYIADLSTKKDQHQFVKLVDIYEGYGYPIRQSVLAGRTLLKMDVIRQTGCDMRGSELFLPPDAQIFDASTADTLRSKAGEMIPCYRTVHKTIRMAKHK